MRGKRFLKRYGGESTEELIALAEQYRVDSILCAFEDALRRRAERVGLDQLTWPETVVIAVESMEGEVNNGGWDQFFRNVPRTLTPRIAECLDAIDCPRTADLARRAIAALPLDGPPTPAAIDALCRAADRRERSERISRFAYIIRKPVLLANFESLNAEYFEAIEPIDERLFSFIKEHRDEIRVQ